MSHCARARDLFGPYWDDETTLAEREWLEGHFATCAGCRASYDELARTLESVGSLPRLEAPADLAERALAAARRATPARDVIFVRETPRWVPVAAAAAVVLLAMATIAPLFGPRGALPTLANRATPIAEPRFVATRANGTPPATTRDHSGSSGMVASLTDSLFDHSEDVDFVLDPVTLRRGRAHTASHLPAGVQGEQAVITF